jgi:hypothetical protein
MVTLASALETMTTRSCTILAVALLFAPGAAVACSCLRPPPPAQALQQCDAVFAGKVTRVDRIGQSQGRLVAFRVRRAWKGVASESAVIHQGGTTCDGEFQPGKDYLVYAFAGGAGNLETNICTRTCPVESAGNDLAALGPPVFKGNLDLQERAEQLAWSGTVIALRLALLALAFLKRPGRRAPA